MSRFWPQPDGAAAFAALSAAVCAFGGAIYGQYQMYIGPDTIAGLGVSLNMVFAVIAGGIWVVTAQVQARRQAISGRR